MTKIITKNNLLFYGDNQKLDFKANAKLIDNYLNKNEQIVENDKYYIYSNCYKIYKENMNNNDNDNKYLKYYEELSKYVNFGIKDNELLNEDDKLALLAYSFNLVVDNIPVKQRNFIKIINNLSNIPDKIQNNITEKLSTKECVLNKNQNLMPLYLQNINNLMDKNFFNRKELITFYALYNALYEIGIYKKSKNKQEMCNVSGINFDIFKSGIIEIFILGFELKDKLFNSIREYKTNSEGNKVINNEYLNWEKFLHGMKSIKAKSLKDKIDMFIQIADEDGNGNLSKEEIYDLSKISLSVFIKNDEVFLNSMSEYFTKLIFETCGIDMEEEIPMQYIKKLILSKCDNYQLLCMFCGADV